MCHVPAAALFLPHICSAWKGSHCEQLLAKALRCREGSAFVPPLPQGSSWTLPSARPGLRGLLCARAFATAPLAPGPAPSPLVLSSFCLIGSISVSSVTSGCEVCTSALCTNAKAAPLPPQGEWGRLGDSEWQGNGNDSSGLRAHPGKTSPAHTILEHPSCQGHSCSMQLQRLL